MTVSTTVASATSGGGNGEGEGGYGHGRHGRAVALCDFLARRFRAAVASSSAARENGIRFDYDVGQYCLETNRARVFPSTGTVSVVFELVPSFGRGQKRSERRPRNGDVERSDEGLVGSLRGVVKKALLSRDRPGGGLNADAARAHVEVGSGLGLGGTGV